jgi:hypothetical protein
MSSAEQTPVITKGSIVAIALTAFAAGMMVVAVALAVVGVA